MIVYCPRMLLLGEKKILYPFHTIFVFSSLKIRTKPEQNLKLENIYSINFHCFRIFEFQILLKLCKEFETRKYENSRK